MTWKDACSSPTWQCNICTREFCPPPPEQANQQQQKNLAPLAISWTELTAELCELHLFMLILGIEGREILTFFPLPLTADFLHPFSLKGEIKYTLTCPIYSIEQQTTQFPFSSNSSEMVRPYSLAIIHPFLQIPAVPFWLNVWQILKEWCIRVIQ